MSAGRVERKEEKRGWMMGGKNIPMSELGRRCRFGALLLTYRGRRAGWEQDSIVGDWRQWSH